MPTVTIELGTCPAPVGATGRIVQYLTDALGVGYVDWTENNGTLPEDLYHDLDVLAQGVRLAYIGEFTVTRLITPTSSRIHILVPFPAGTQYDVIAYF